MRLKGFIFTIDGVIALAFLIAASLTILTFYHAAPEENKYADVQQLGLDYLNTSAGTLLTQAGFSTGTSGIHASKLAYPIDSVCVYTPGPDFTNPALTTVPPNPAFANCKYFTGVWVT